MQLKSLLKENEKDSLILKFENKIKQKEKEIKQRENVISNLNEEGTDLANQVIALEKERNYLLNELNNSKNLESGVFSLKEKKYIEKIESYKNTIKEFQSEAVPLYEEYTKLKDRLSHKDDLLKKQLKVIRQLNERKNKLKDKLNYEMLKEPEVIREEKLVYLGKDNLNISNTISLLTNISRKKQGNKKLTWKEWLDIPENVYLLNINEELGKKVFRESNRLIQEAINNSNSSNSVNSQGLKGQTITPLFGLDFDGDRQSLNTTFPEEDSEQTPTDRTYSWWMKASVTGGNRGCWGYGGRRREAFHLNQSNRPELNLGNNFLARWSDIPEQDDGEWHHWMVFSDVSDPSSAELYVDGVSIALHAGSTKTNGSLNDHDATALVIGGCDTGNDNSEHFEGSITNFAVFSGDVTSRAVSHYNNGIPKDVSNESDLVHYSKITDKSLGNATFDGDAPTFNTMMKVKDTIHRGKQLTASISKNERG
tara:strand:- start:4 stop:1446 length:1443 start_codon:yes stop_codon:yes gene_type:complete